MNNKEYENPLITRYSSKDMSYIFSNEFRFKTWRKLWVYLAEEEKKLGLKITDTQINELKKFQDNINYDKAIEFEKIYKHEVMSHIYAYGNQCPNAKAIIHLGATSAYVLDNTDLIQIKNALLIIKKQLLEIIIILKDFALKNKDIITLGFTHYQVAQPTTVGKRASLWLQEIVYDYKELIFRLDNLEFRGVKGTTGTQNSFLKLFDGNKVKVFALDENITQKCGFKKNISVTGQTYSRKIDYHILSLLSSIAQSCHKFSNDIRLLHNLKEIEEPFGQKQIGSSAMPYKQNPMRSERIASLSRYVINLSQNASMTASQQWFERTLDDSANKRITIPEAFLASNAILRLYNNVASGLNVNEKTISQNLKKELPFMISEDIIMKAVKNGGDRQTVHNAIRESSFEAIKQMKENGYNQNPLNNILSKNPNIPLTFEELENITLDQKLSGLSAIQVEKFVENEIKPILENETKNLDSDIYENIEY